MFYGLLFLSEDDRAINLKSRDAADQIKTYIENAIALSRSLHLHGFSLTLLTNRENLVNKIVAEYGDPVGLNVKSPKFDLDVPKGIAFYSAHFKIDAMKFIANLNRPYSCLIDLDMFCLRPPSSAILNCIDRQLPMYYDITDQVAPAYGCDRIIRSMQMLNSQAFEGRWAGGEFLGGNSHFFASLLKYIEDIWPIYIEKRSDLHHQGDEMIISVALEKMRHSGFYMVDCGALAGVGRFWSGRTKHHQVNFAKFSDSCFLLHLPQDKKFIARFVENGRSVERTSFLGCYVRYLKWRRMRMTGSHILRKYRVARPRIIETPGSR